ncbi:Single-stranded DNA-binding protein [Caminicella sporogenes DSM 14501]|uniref:Single-stranded DNA-binding protein n=1 Tax=Caminicella sporogenes DSM 14501 TaxID=1121266 RepID=A0A1M6R6V1_9FIRM|nr:single-stranded DNA-binding protein [Caminicella sporogenes]RKD27323.1 single-stranded DNA-binding protein [Caminicella sporogenes]SHK28156.1 Single-stranded DNA-binding protein [Caminicella sporogenes DSM 14501]
MRTFDNNVVTVVGTICSDLKFSHEVFGEGFYNFKIKIPRLSNYNDILPVTISERLLVDFNFSQDKLVKIDGQLRSYNKIVNEKNKLILTIFARDISEEDEENVTNPNQIFLDGYICKKPIYRTTPFGREITDMLVAVNRPYKKSDYIPCIAWGRNARFSEKMKVGDRIKIWGRIQSREYQKKIDEENVVKKVAYEVSISKMSALPEDNNRLSE